MAEDLNLDLDFGNSFEADTAVYLVVETYGIGSLVERGAMFINYLNSQSTSYATSHGQNS